MTDKRTKQILTGALILNSLLLGLMLFFLFAAVSCISTVLDQESSYKAFPSITEWAVNFRPKNLISTLSLIIVVVATSLFVGLSLKRSVQDISGIFLYFTIHSSLWLLAGAYFLFFVMAVAFSYIHVGGGLYTASNAPPPPPSMIATPSVDSRIWLAAALAYSVGLFIRAITVSRRRKEAEWKVRPIRGQVSERESGLDT